MHQSSLFNQCHSSSTLVKTHSRVNSKDCRGPECSHVPLHCHDQAHHGPPASTFCQEPHIHPSPWSCPVQCCKQACAQLCSLLALTPCPGFLDCWHVIIDPWRVNLNHCCQHLCSAWEQRDCAVPTRIVPFPSCQLPARQPCSCCFLTKAPIFVREIYSCCIEGDLQFHCNLVELTTVKEKEEGKNREVTHTSLYIINYLFFSFLSQKLHCQKHLKH